MRKETKVKFLCNCGAVYGKIIGVFGGQYATVGSRVTIAVKQATSTGKVKKKQVVQAIVVQTRDKVKHPGWSMSFGYNGVVAIDHKGNPIATGKSKYFSCEPKKLDPLANKIFKKIMDKNGKSYVYNSVNLGGVINVQV